MSDFEKLKELIIKIPNIDSYLEDRLSKLGNKLYNARINKGYSQQQLAESIGVDVSKIQRMEAGDSYMTVEDIYLCIKTIGNLGII